MTFDLSEHWKAVNTFNGKRIEKIFWYGYIPYGWVVDAEIPEEIRLRLKSPVIPLRPGGWNPFLRRKASQYVKRMQEAGQGVMLMVPHERPEGGYKTRFVYYEHLKKEPHILLKDISAAFNSADTELVQSIECAYLAITGNTDLG